MKDCRNGIGFGRFGGPLAVLAVLLAAAPLTGCGKANGKVDADGKKDEPAAVPVEVTLPKVGDMVAVYTGTAAVSADNQAFVMPKVRGEIREVFVNEGDHVAAGQVLVRLDDDQLRLEAAQAQANMLKLQRDYARNLELQKRGLVSVTAFDNLKYELDAARATYELAALQLSYAKVRSPIAGVVTARMPGVKVGNTVTPVGGVIQSSDSSMFVVTDFDSLVVDINVPEGQMPKLAVGQPADVTVDAVPGQRFSGRISLITPRVDPATATFPVKIHLDDPQRVLRPGMFARVAIVYDRRHDAVQIPRSALLDGDGPPKVFIVQGDKAVERPLKLGLSNGGFVEVLSGIARGDKVITVGQGALKAGTAVQVVNEPAPSQAAG